MEQTEAQQNVRIIAHLDMDAFFASVEERDNPKLKGLPVAVGSDPKEGHGRGVVSTANYKAREYGIHSALPISRAWRLSEEARRKGLPAVVFITSNFKKYTKSSARIMDIIREYSFHIEQSSIDEAYFDLSHLINFTSQDVATRFIASLEVCEKIKSKIQEKEKLTASIGIGPNKLIAKLASDFKKPDGLTLVRENEKDAFLEKLPLRKIPGIGPKTEIKLLQRQLKTVKDIKKLSREELKDMCGKWGLDLYEKVRGRDSSPIIEQYEPKSIGEQETFEHDTLDSQFIFKRFHTLSENIIKRLGDTEVVQPKLGTLSASALRDERPPGLQAQNDAPFKRPADSYGFRTVVITIRFSDFETKTRSHTLHNPANDLKTLEFEVMKLILPFLDKRLNPRKKLIRLIGVRVEKLG